MLRLIEAASSEPDAPRSQSSAAYARLKGDILTGRAIPGDKLKINEIAGQLSVSPGAVREALSRMVPEGLVVSRDQRGFTVAPLSIEDLEDLTELRCDIEEIALRRAVLKGDSSWEASVLGSAHRLRRTPRVTGAGQPNMEWVGLHETFHYALVSGCGSRRLLALHSHLYQQSERYRILSLNVEGDRDVDAEHQGLVDAALDRDADLLVQLIRDHFQRTTTCIVEAAKSSPEFASR